MKSELLKLGYAPVPYTLSDGTDCVGVILPLSRQPAVVSVLEAELTASTTLNPTFNVFDTQSIMMGKDLLLYWPTIPF